MEKIKKILFRKIVSKLLQKKNLYFLDSETFTNEKNVCKLFLVLETITSKKKFERFYLILKTVAERKMFFIFGRIWKVLKTRKSLYIFTNNERRNPYKQGLVEDVVFRNAEKLGFRLKKDGNEIII